METVYQLAQGFMSMLNQQQAKSLALWLAAVQSCGIAELERFGRGIEQDQAAVVAGLTLPGSQWSGRGPGESAQADQTHDVWAGTLSPPVPAYSSCRVIE